jgi:basic membrane protein A
LIKNISYSLKISIIFIIIASVFLIPSTRGQVPPKVSLVLTTGGLGDLSFNDVAYKGLKQANDTFTLGITDADWAEPSDIQEITDIIDIFSQDGSYDLIISLTFASIDGVNNSAPVYSDQNYAIIDAIVDYPNVASIIFKEEEGSFLAGLMAGMTTTTNKIAFLGGLNLPIIDKFRAGFEQGVKTINPEAEYLLHFHLILVIHGGILQEVDL